VRYRGLICVGRILKSYGAKGEVVVVSETEYPETLVEYKYFYIRYKGEQKKLDVETAKKSRRRFIFKFKDIETLEKAKAIEGHYLFVKREDLIETDDEGFYVFDLEGLTAFDEKGKKVGILETVMKRKPYDYFIILNEEGREIILPAIKEYIKKIDFENEKIILNIPEGL
jgi:16S rRNA processing protein RimM